MHSVVKMQWQQIEWCEYGKGKGLQVLGDLVNRAGSTKAVVIGRIKTV